MAAPDHEKRMRQALHQADLARKVDEVPVGALVVCQGQIIGRGYNKRESGYDVTLHAEMIAIRQACRYLKSWRLDQCDLYVTLEPCVMCAGAIQQARIRTLYYGADDPKTGACGSVVDVFSLPSNHQVTVVKGILKKESSELLQSFFRQKRLAARLHKINTSAEAD